MTKTKERDWIVLRPRYRIIDPETHVLPELSPRAKKIAEMHRQQLESKGIILGSFVWWGNKLYQVVFINRMNRVRLRPFGAKPFPGCNDMYPGEYSNCSPLYLKLAKVTLRNPG